MTETPEETSPIADNVLLTLIANAEDFDWVDLMSWWARKELWWICRFLLTWTVLCYFGGDSDKGAADLSFVEAS